MESQNIQEVMQVEAEIITVRVGNLTIETPRGLFGEIAPVFGTRILLDGKPVPFGVTRIELVGDIDEAWVVKLTGFVKG